MEQRSAVNPVAILRDKIACQARQVQRCNYCQYVLVALSPANAETKGDLANYLLAEWLITILQTVYLTVSHNRVSK